MFLKIKIYSFSKLQIVVVFLSKLNTYEYMLQRHPYGVQEA